MAKPPFEDGLNEYRVVDGQVQTRLIGARAWTTIPRQHLLEHAVDSPLWDYLRSHGLNRPSPSGQAPEADREKVQLKLRVDPSIPGILAVLAQRDGKTMSDYVADFILRQMKTLPKT